MSICMFGKWYNINYFNQEFYKKYKSRIHTTYYKLSSFETVALCKLCTHKNQCKKYIGAIIIGNKLEKIFFYYCKHHDIIDIIQVLGVGELI